MFEIGDQLKDILFQLNPEKVTPEDRGRESVEHSRLHDLLNELGIAGPDEKERYAILIGRHLGLSPDDIAKAMQDPSNLEDIVSEKFEQLLPTAAGVIDLREAELKKRVLGPKLSHKVEINAECLPLSNGKFSIIVHPPLTNFCWKMSKLWATRLGQDSKVSFEHTAKLAARLMRGFWAGRINRVEVIPLLDLNPAQANFAGALTSGAEDFVLGHELGHVLSYLAPDRFSSLMNLAVSAGHSAISIIEKNNPGFPKHATIAKWGKDKIAENWGTEFVADVIGGFLALSIATDDHHARLRTYCAVESILIMFDMLENSYGWVHKDVHPLTAHPPGTLRLQMVRATLRKSDWSYAYIFGESLEKISKDILQVLGLECSDYALLSRIRIETTSPLTPRDKTKYWEPGVRV